MKNNIYDIKSLLLDERGAGSLGQSSGKLGTFKLNVAK